MAKVKYNVVTHGISGKIGDLLQFRQRHGKTIISKIASRSGTVTPAQQNVRDRFRLAAAYAKSAMGDPELRNLYSSRAVGDISAFNVALKDFFDPPVITDVNTDSYSGQVGNTIRITAVDDTKVTQVKVQLFDSDEGLMEEGVATRFGETDDWVYTATVFIPAAAMGKLVIEASDLPGNKTSFEKLLV